MLELIRKRIFIMKTQKRELQLTVIIPLCTLYPIGFYYFLKRIIKGLMNSPGFYIISLKISGWILNILIALKFSIWQDCLTKTAKFHCQLWCWLFGVTLLLMSSNVYNVFQITSVLCLLTIENVKVSLL